MMHLLDAAVDEPFVVFPVAPGAYKRNDDNEQNKF